MNSAGAGAVAVQVRKKRQCAGVDNNHTKMLSAVTAYLLSKKKFFFVSNISTYYTTFKSK